MRVAFFWPEGDVAAVSRLDPDRDCERFATGEAAWILQTFLRLAAAGHPAELVAAPPEQGLLVVHARHCRRLPAHSATARDPVLVVVRGERTRSLSSHFEIVQTRWPADGRRRLFVPHWPQPGLRPRDPARGERLATLAYKGFLQNLHPDFRSERWSSFLAGLGIEWVVDAETWHGQPAAAAARRWANYATTDAVLAVRPRDFNTPLKPATKLTNAWQAGVPALLGPEAAYREIRRSPLDYLEVGTLAAARRAVLELVERPELYATMVAHGRERAAEYANERVLARWVELLYEILPARAGALGGAPPRSARLLPFGWRRRLARSRAE